jgi:Leucine-rich repeat (LRR) protein
VRSLRHLRDLGIHVRSGDGLERLARVPELKRVTVTEARPDILSLLGPHDALESVEIAIDGSIEDLGPLAALQSLRSLTVNPHRFPGGLGFVSRLPALEFLSLSGLDDIRDFSPIAEQQRLRELYLEDCVGLDDIGLLRPLYDLRYLYLKGARLGSGGCASLSEAFPKLSGLVLGENDWVEDIGPLARLPLTRLFLWGCSRLRDLGPLARLDGLTVLNLRGVPFKDLAPLARLGELDWLILDDCVSTTDLTPLAGLAKLKTLSLCDSADIDLAPLSQQRGLSIKVSAGQRVLGTDRLHKSTKIDWEP